MGRVQSLFIVLFISVLLFSVGKTETEDIRAALVDFMEKLEPGSMKDTANWGWNKSSDPCMTNGTGLNYNNLSGSIPPEISDCKVLTVLYLEGNHFSGVLPDSLSDMANLNNHFSGKLPKFNYGQLDDLDVSNNDLSGKVPDDADRFGAKSFLGNPGLCGKELPKKCGKKKEKQILL
ncbi:probable inactive receptor kinase [Tanacetum coccineum]